MGDLLGEETDRYLLRSTISIQQFKPSFTHSTGNMKMVQTPVIGKHYAQNLVNLWEHTAAEFLNSGIYILTMASYIGSHHEAFGSSIWSMRMSTLEAYVGQEGERKKKLKQQTTVCHTTLSIATSPGWSSKCVFPIETGSLLKLGVEWNISNASPIRTKRWTYLLCRLANMMTFCKRVLCLSSNPKRVD